MFVVRANVPPVYRLFVLNRASLDNFVVGLSPDLAIDVTADFVIYKSGDGGVYGRVSQRLERFGLTLSARSSSQTTLLDFGSRKPRTEIE